MRQHRLLMTMLLVGFLIGCKDGDPIWQVCTDEFAFVALTVPGPPLTDFYTVRVSTSDTIRVDREKVFSDNQYIVLDDTHLNLLKGRQEKFRFVGIQGDTIVVNEAYVIRADRCHIQKVSGKDTI